MREATDLGIGAAVRRELAGRRIDLSKIKFPVKAGVVTLQGELAFVGTNKTADEIAIELKFIESSLKQIAGVKELVFELESWTRNESGIWESGQSPASAPGTGSGNTAGGEGLYCDECDMVIRFCPCCGKSLTTSAKIAVHPRRATPPPRPIIKKKLPTAPLPSAQNRPAEPVKSGSMPAMPTPSPAGSAPTARPAGIPSAPVTPFKPGAAPVKPAGSVPAAKPAAPTVKPPVIPAAKPPVPAPAPTAEPAPAHKPVTTAPAMPAMPASKPAPDFGTAHPHSHADSADDMNFDGLNIDLGSTPEPTHPTPHQPATPKPVPAIHPVPVPHPIPHPAPGPRLAPTPAAEAAPTVPTPDFMKSDALNGDLFGSLIDNLSQSGDEESPEHSGKTDDEGVPDLNLASLDDFASSAPENSGSDAEPEAEPPFEDMSDLLPPMKPATAGPFENIDEIPLPPVKPATAEPVSFEDDDTPLPPMKPRTPAGKENKDPFAALFSESDMGLGGGTGEGGKDPFASLDLDLDVLEVFPSDDQPALPPAKPAAGSKKPAPGKPAPPVDDNPFNIDNIIDLDTPVEDKPKAGKKPAKDPFDLDDFDIGKFKL